MLTLLPLLQTVAKVRLLQRPLNLTTSGAGSPVIYSTGNITANNVNGVANNSEIGVVEGKNSITLANSNVTGYKDNGFMLYQSFSGDAESGIARLKAENNQTLTTHATGAFIYVNNTTAEGRFV